MISRDKKAELPKYEKTNGVDYRTDFKPRKPSPLSRPSLQVPQITKLRLAAVFVAVTLIVFLFGSHHEVSYSDVLQSVQGYKQYVSDSIKQGSISSQSPAEAHRKPLGEVSFVDLKETAGSWKTNSPLNQRVLVCMPLRNVEKVVPVMASHLRNLTYDHNLIDLAFLISDTDDNTVSLLEDEINAIQSSADPKMPFHKITLLFRDFGSAVGTDFSDRHGVAVQGVRRKLMGKARNWLLSSLLEPTHSWVYWRDADIETAPPTIIEDLMKHDVDVIVPNVWRPLPDWLGSEQPYDLNSWQESQPALDLAATLDEDEVIVEGYAEYPTYRPHLAYVRSADGNPDEQVDLDGIGGVSILARSRVFLSGAHFTGFTFENHAETEAFGKMCKKMGFTVRGLPHYTVWHMYEPSDDDLKEMMRREKEEKEKEKQEKGTTENKDLEVNEAPEVKELDA
ncbi:Mannan polymerase II complex anp1 subunit [Yarrowia sp. B02]|nr:Mannan polymerase II complex anp1 subunit [Yarrowia sp. B02]